jgi:hypothetical protein
MIKLLGFIVFLFIVNYFYDKINNKLNSFHSSKETQHINDFLFESKKNISKNKNIIWVHINYEPNSRNWVNFKSRKTNELNQPYKLITLKSIINNSLPDYDVCVINDNSFKDLIPGWSIDINNLSEPIKSHTRSLALIKVMYYYGGMLVPSSYLALNKLKYLENIGFENKNSFFVEIDNKNVSSNLISSFPSHRFMGCKKECPEIKELMLFVERLISSDYTAEQTFLGEINKKCYELCRNNKSNIIKSKIVGVRDENNKYIRIEDLLGSSYINFCNNLNGIYIPDDEILIRTKYQWFARMSEQQIYNSNMIISKYMLISN